MSVAVVDELAQRIYSNPAWANATDAEKADVEAKLEAARQRGGRPTPHVMRELVQHSAELGYYGDLTDPTNVSGISCYQRDMEVHS